VRRGRGSRGRRSRGSGLGGGGYLSGAGVVCVVLEQERWLLVVGGLRIVVDGLSRR
jgi:hypothetical protein